MSAGAPSARPIATPRRRAPGLGVGSNGGDPIYLFCLPGYLVPQLSNRKLSLGILNHNSPIGTSPWVSSVADWRRRRCAQPRGVGRRSGFPPRIVHKPHFWYTFGSDTGGSGECYRGHGQALELGILDFPQFADVVDGGSAGEELHLLHLRAPHGVVVARPVSHGLRAPSQPHHSLPSALPPVSHFTWTRYPPISLTSYEPHHTCTTPSHQPYLL
eukprot:4422759-Pyramimonas_sp.AAC.1